MVVTWGLGMIEWKEDVPLTREVDRLWGCDLAQGNHAAFAANRGRNGAISEKNGRSDWFCGEKGVPTYLPAPNMLVCTLWL